MTQIRPSSTAHGRKQSRASRKSPTWQQVTLIVLGTALSVSALSSPSVLTTGATRNFKTMGFGVSGRDVW